jgi:hypothetical protein
MKYVLDSRLVINWLKINHKLGCVVDYKCNVRLGASGHMDETINYITIRNQIHILNFNVKCEKHVKNQLHSNWHKC